MANQSDSIWNRVPGLRPYCIKQRQEHKVKLARDIAAMASAAFTTSVTEDQVYKMLCRAGAWELPDVPDEIPSHLLEPAGGFAQPIRREKPKHPEGWEPHVEENGDTAIAISQPTDNPNPDEEWLIKSWNFDPKEWQIQGAINCRRWQGVIPVETGTVCKCEPKIDEPHYEHPWQFYYKASLVRRTSRDYLDIAKLCEEIKRHKPKKRETMRGDRAFAVCVSDTQAGKADGDGTTGMVARFLRAIDSVEERVKALRRNGEPIGTLYVFGLGDLIENCDGYYAIQTFTVQLNRRDQIKLMRRLLLKAIMRWSTLAERVVVAAVGGNHAENRKDGKAFTDLADNDDVAIFEQVQEILAANPEAFGHVSFVLPNERLDHTLDVAGTIVGLAHGHQAGRGVGAVQKIANWWKDQAHGMQPIGDAQLLLTGHLHHLVVHQTGAKTHIQVPALDGGSEWWRNATGQDAPPGILTLTIGKNVGPAGWSNLLVL